MPWLAQFRNPQGLQPYDAQEKVFCCGEHAEQYAQSHALVIRASRRTQTAVQNDRCQFCGAKDLT